MSIFASRGWTRPATMAALCAAALAGCTGFSGKAPLPRHAALDAGSAPGEPSKLAGLVTQADVLYFPSEDLVGSGRDSSIALLQEMTRISGDSAVAWDSIDGDQQPLFDHWRDSQTSTDEILAQLNIAGTERDRENCRAILRVFGGTMRHVALRCPDRILAQLRLASDADASQNPEIPRGFTVAQNDFEMFGEQLPAARGVAEHDLRKLYRAYTVTEQFAAECIVRYLNEHPEGKLLVFVHRRHLDTARGVPQFVAQKVKRRQIVLEPQPSRPDISASVAQLGRSARQIIDRSPASAVD
ncbi:MAG: ChaN family lipoprotein [Chthoniobacterales bacterium]